MSNFYKSLGDCVASKQHLTACDADGYCLNCGEQAEDVTEFATPVDPPKPMTPSEFFAAAHAAMKRGEFENLGVLVPDEHVDRVLNKEADVPVAPAFEGTFKEDVPLAPPYEPFPDLAYSEFTKWDIRTGTITLAEKIKKKDRLLHLEVWLGSDVGSRTIVAGIAEHFDPTFLVGIQVMVVTNLEPRKLGGFMSHGMILAGMGPNGLSLAGCMGVPDGTEIG